MPGLKLTMRKHLGHGAYTVLLNLYDPGSDDTTSDSMTDILAPQSASHRGIVRTVLGSLDPRLSSNMKIACRM